MTGEITISKAAVKKWVIIITCSLLAFLLIYFLIHYLVNRPTPMPAEMKAQVDSLKNDMQVLKRANVELSQQNETLQQAIAGQGKRGEVIKQDIDRNETRKVNIPKEYEKISNTVATWSDASIDSFFAARYGHR